MFKQIATLASLFLITLSIDAQDDVRSRTIIDQLIQKSKNYQSFQANFTSRLQSKADGLDVSQKGTVKAKGKKFQLTMDDHTIYCDGNTVWTYSSETNEVTLTDPSELDQELDPSKLLSMYEKGYKSQFIEETKDAAGQVLQVIKLFPIEASKKPFHTVVIKVDKAKLEPKEVKVLYKDGNEVTYTLNGFQADVSMDDTIFTFNKVKHPGVMVNDMR